MREKISATERAIRRSLKNGIKMATSPSSKTVEGDGTVKIVTYEKDKSEFMLILQGDIAGRDTSWTTDARHDEFAEYVESIKQRMTEEE